MRTITKLIPFNIEMAQNGAKVITRDKHDVHINKFEGGNICYPIEACIRALPHTNETDEIKLFTKEGRLFNDCEHEHDLFIEVEEIVKEEENKKRTEINITDERKQYLEYIGLSSSSDVRTKNAGKSDYSKQIIQPWTIWHSYPGIHTIDKDIIKRVLRTKEEGNLSPIDSRILDYNKIIHDCEERIRQLKVLRESILPFVNFETEDDELIQKQLYYNEVNSK